MSSRRFLLVAIASVALTSCNTAQTHIGDEDPGFGEAVKYNSAMQTINPAPVYAANSTKPGSNGEVGAAAVKRYRTDKVKAVEMMQTTSGTAAAAAAAAAAA